jgi:glucose-6-phosphate 1-epimerase
VRTSLGAGMLGTASGLGGCASATPSPGTAPPRPRLPSLVLPHPSGARAEVVLQGAHVTDWIRPDGAAVLFLSRATRMEPGAAIRGGIPVVFPQFAGLGPLPSHGLLRTIPWTVAESGLDSDGAVFARLRRADDEATRSLWPHPFLAELLVALDDALTTTLRIRNTGDRPFECQAALHTYHHVGDIRSVRVEGLDGLPYLDRTADGAERAGAPGPLRIEGHVDRIYLGAPDRLRVHVPARGWPVAVETLGFADAVVWNPWVERARAAADLADDEYAVMLCVEPANIARPVRLEPGQSWSGTQRLRIEQI